VSALRPRPANSRAFPDYNDIITTRHYLDKFIDVQERQVVLQFGASEAVMIGDTPYDAEAASGAGTAAAGVLTGGFSIDALRGAGCFAIADEVSRLLVSLDNAKSFGAGA